MIEFFKNNKINVAMLCEKMVNGEHKIQTKGAQK